MTWAVIDLETTIASLHGRKASPFHPDNYVVMAGWATKENPEPEGRRFPQSESYEQLGELFVGLLRGRRWLVGVNIKFDLLHILRDPVAYTAWQNWVADGGLVWDCQQVEYLLEGQDQNSHMLSLNELAMRYDEDTKVDEVKVLWEAGVDTPDIDPDLLARYLLGETMPNGLRREGDIGNTRNIFLKQLAKVKARDMARLVAVEAGALICSIEMERNGMLVNKSKGLSIAAELREELAQAQAELDAYLPADLPFAFNWTNRYHLSPIVFGGAVKFERRQYDLAGGGTTFECPAAGEGVYVQKDETHYVLADGKTAECAWYEHVLGTEGVEDKRVQYKSGKNAGEYKTKRVKVNDYDKPKSRMAQDSWQFPGYTKPDPAWESSTPGLYSVASDVIDTLTANASVPFLKALGRVTSISKDVNTYFISEDGQKGMLTLVGDDGLVHHSINHTSTVTGRLSGSRPNLQNLPKGQKSRAKELFESRFPGGDIGQSDFSSLEIYCQANLTRCAQLVRDLLEGKDLHCVRLAEQEGMDYDEVLKLSKGYEDADGNFVEPVPEWDYKRTGAKVFSFRRAYGAGNQTIADGTGLPLETVEALAAAEDARYPEINKYFDALESTIVENAEPTSAFVNHPDNPAIRVQLKISHITTPDGKRYTFRSHPAPKFQLKQGVTSTFSPTERKNYPVQGMGGQIMKLAMWIAVREFYRRHNWGGQALLVNTVHDAMYRDASPQWSYDSSVVMHACMLAASDMMVHWCKWPLQVAVPSDSVRGASMAEETQLRGQQFVADYQSALAEIRARYMPGYTPSFNTLEN